MLLIENTEDLENFCKEMNKEPFITVDLEFMREKTYYAQICLIQVGSKNSEAIIDPMAKGIDLSPFWNLMQNKKIVKVFHSCRQDIEIIYNMSGHIPTPIFDTQIAAMACGFGENISYEHLVNELLNRELDKTCRLTNWSIRPLDKTQLEYALSDVTHLVDIYEKMTTMLKEKGREHWLDEEIACLEDPDCYVVQPENAWMRIKHSSHSQKFLRALQKLAEWREIRAQNSNVPRQTIIKDECLVSIAAMWPKSVDDLKKVRNIRPDIVNGKLGTEILEAVKTSNTGKNPKLKQLERGKNVHSHAIPLYEMLKFFLRIVSQQEGVVARLIASDDDLKMLAMCQQDEKNPVLQGWRKTLFGEDALLLREGKMQLRYDKKKEKIDFFKD